MHPGEKNKIRGSGSAEQWLQPLLYLPSVNVNIKIPNRKISISATGYPILIHLPVHQLVQRDDDPVNVMKHLVIVDHRHNLLHGIRHVCLKDRFHQCGIRKELPCPLPHLRIM